MILKEPGRWKINKNWIYAVLIFLAACALIYLFLFIQKHEAKEGVIYASDFETVFGDYYDNHQHMPTKDLRTKETSRSGDYSVRVDIKNKYGPKAVFKDLIPGMHYRASVWRIKTPGQFNSYFSVYGDDGKSFYTNTREAIREEGDWELLELFFKVPEVNTQKEIYLLFYYGGSEGGSEYFDDLQLEIVGNDSFLPKLDIPFLTLYLDASAANKLDTYSADAMRVGILSKENKQYVKAKLIENGEEKNVKIRLKGDWTDHLIGTHKSYRIKTTKEESWHRLKEFSVMRPDKRNMLVEWMYHNVLEENDVLTPRYEFVNLRLNDGKYVAYVVEEHFTKQLIESKSRREGLILKWDEDAMWAARLRKFKAGIYEDTYLIQEFGASEVLSFDDKGIVKDSSQIKMMSEAIGKVELFLEGNDPVGIMDIERFAKCFAIAELFYTQHSVIWHNLRFYYNPITKLIEPIAFDGSGEEYGSKGAHFKCMGCHLNHFEYNDWIEFYAMFFRHEAFIEKFVFYLNEFSKAENVSLLINKYSEQVGQLNEFLAIDYPEYKYDFIGLKGHAKKLQAILRPYNESSVKGYEIARHKTEKTIIVTNNYGLPISIIGIGRHQSEVDGTDEESFHHFLLNNPTNRVRHYDTLTVPVDAKYLFFQVPGLPERYYSEIKVWVMDKTVADGYKGELSIPLAEESFVIDDKNMIHLRKGQYQFSEPMIIPVGYHLKVLAGTSIDLVNGAHILSHSPVSFIGKEDDPIMITSTDKTGQGLTVFGDLKEESRLLYTSISGQGNLTSSGYSLLGSVNFYESNVTISYSEIAHNSCEDALNIVRSNFVLDNSFIHHTFADGLDSDFSEGTITKTRFSNTGNDGSDFSGSVISIDNSLYTAIGDKAVSAGEESKVTIGTIHIDGAKIGVASKDLSLVYASVINLNNVITGMTAYQKKPEFGGATIHVDSLTSKEVIHLVLNDEQSKVLIK